MRLQEKLKNDDYLKHVDFTFEKLEKHDLDIKKKIEPLILIKLHNSWLHNFNKKFLRKL